MKLSFRTFTIVGLGFFLFAGGVIAKEFSDIPVQHPNYAAVEYLSESGVILGQGERTVFDPYQEINRAEWAQLLVRQAGVSPSRLSRNCFLDITDQWYAPAVCYSSSIGWIKGYQAGPEKGFFLPVRTLNTAEILITLSRLYSWDISEGEHWYTGAMEYAKNAKIVGESAVFDQSLTRAEAAEILFRSVTLETLQVSKYEPFLAELMLARLSDEPTPPDTTDPTQPTQNTVYLTSFAEQPSSATIPYGSLYVPVIRFQIEPQQDVQLDEISVRRISVGLTEDLSTGRLLINGKVLRESPFLMRENAVFWRDLNFDMKSGEQYLVEMNVDFVENARAHLEYQFEVEPSRLLFQDAQTQVVGEKIIGKPYNISPISADSIEVINPSSVLRIPFMEEEDQILSRFQIIAGTHDVLIKRIRLQNASSVETSGLTNFRLTAGSETISVAPSIQNDVLDFQINDLLIEAGRRRTFTLMGDIGGGRIFDSILFYLEEPEHIHAYDIVHGFGVRVDNQFSRQTAWCVGSTTIQCPAQGLRKRCSNEDREIGVKDCEE
jgi:hypothetical protein